MRLEIQRKAKMFIYTTLNRASLTLDIEECHDN